jgi:outer membrane protein TolC
LAALRAGYDTQEARIYRAVLGQYPRFNLGLSEVRDTAGVRSQSIGISLDIPLFNSANRGVIAEAEATRDKLYAEYLARLYQTRADIATLIADLYRIGQEYEALVQQLPELERVERVLRAAVASGDTSLVNYETVRATLLDKQIKLLSLEQAAAEQEVALQLASGAPLAL